MEERNDTVTCRLFEKHGMKQVGFWTVAIGASNDDLVYVLQRESLADCEQKFGAFAVDPKWIEARAASEAGGGPIVASITNSILVPTSFSALK